MILIESNLWDILAGFIFCHNILLVFFLILYILKNKKVKSETKNWIYTLNTLLPFFCGIYLLSFPVVFFTASYGQNFYELFSFRDLGYMFFVKELLPLLIGILFFLKRLRLNFVLIFIYLFAAHFNLIETLWMKMWRDYLPSSWSKDDDSYFAAIFLKWILPPILILLNYLLLYKRNKLPYPSAFFKNHVQ